MVPARMRGPSPYPMKKSRAVPAAGPQDGAQMTAVSHLVLGCVLHRNRHKVLMHIFPYSGCVPRRRLRSLAFLLSCQSAAFGHCTWHLALGQGDGLAGLLAGPKDRFFLSLRQQPEADHWPAAALSSVVNLCSGSLRFSSRSVPSHHSGIHGVANTDRVLTTNEALHPVLPVIHTRKQAEVRGAA